MNITFKDKEMKLVGTFGVLLLCVLNSFGQNINERIKPYFERFGVNGSFVLYDAVKDCYLRYNETMCDSLFMPAATFNLVNSLIALNESVIIDEQQTIPWEGHTFPIEAWNKDQTLNSAMRNSCVWVFFGFSEQLTLDTYQYYLKKFNYGNQTLVDNQSGFWMTGGLKISANQQIEFLKGFYNNAYELLSKTIDVAKKTIVIKGQEKNKVSLVKGHGEVSEKEGILWQVGYVEKGENVYYFALNAIIPKGEGTKELSRFLLEDILVELDVADPR